MMAADSVLRKSACEGVYITFGGRCWTLAARPSSPTTKAAPSTTPATPSPPPPGHHGGPCPSARASDLRVRPRHRRADRQQRTPLPGPVLPREIAAHAALAGTRVITPKTRTRMVEYLRVLRIARSTAVKARPVALQMLPCQSVSAPKELRCQEPNLTRIQLKRRCATWRPDETASRDGPVHRQAADRPEGLRRWPGTSVSPGPRTPRVQGNRRPFSLNPRVHRCASDRCGHSPTLSWTGPNRHHPRRVGPPFPRLRNSLPVWLGCRGSERFRGAAFGVLGRGGVDEAVGR